MTFQFVTVKKRTKETNTNAKALGSSKGKNQQTTSESHESGASINRMEGLILAQGERWRRALHMQVERELFLIYLGRKERETVANE